MKIDITVETPVITSTRVKQLSAMFDAPIQDVSRLSWRGELPVESFEWNVGLIVGPSGSGKSTILRDLFGLPTKHTWAAGAVIDDFSRHLTMEDIASVCQAVGFNTIPAWMRPYRVLSNGEKFRVSLARHLLEDGDTIILDEFTSVVDRQVAKIGSHAVQKYVRRNGKRLVVASCHYDIIDWLQPDWIFDPAMMSFTRRSLQQRPKLHVDISRVHYSAWRLFAPFHYLTASLNTGSVCFVLFCEDQPASFAGVLTRPHPRVKGLKGVSRLVTLPDWQGLGLAMILCDVLGAAYKALSNQLHTYPAHPALIRSFVNSPKWKITRKPGDFTRLNSRTTTIISAGFGARPNAVFEYIGDMMPRSDALKLIERRLG